MKTNNIILFILIITSINAFSMNLCQIPDSLFEKIFNKTIDNDFLEAPTDSTKSNSKLLKIWTKVYKINICKFAVCCIKEFDLTLSNKVEEYLKTEILDNDNITYDKSFEFIRGFLKTNVLDLCKKFNICFKENPTYLNIYQRIPKPLNNVLSIIKVELNISIVLLIKNPDLYKKFLYLFNTENEPLKLNYTIESELNTYNGFLYHIDLLDKVNLDLELLEYIIKTDIKHIKSEHYGDNLVFDYYSSYPLTCISIQMINNISQLYKIIKKYKIPFTRSIKQKTVTSSLFIFDNIILIPSLKSELDNLLNPEII